MLIKRFGSFSRINRYFTRSEKTYIFRLLSTMTEEVPKIDTSKFQIKKEGSASILYPQDAVFYNPIQQYNRDLSIHAIRAWTELDLAAKAEKDAKRKAKVTDPSTINNNKQAKIAADGTPKPVEQENDNINSNNDEQLKQETESSTEKTEEVKPYIRILEALSASGLRAIRYGKEIPHVDKIIANDLSKDAVESIRTNSEYNNVLDKVVPNEGDAILYMSSKRRDFHIVDLDPYGTAAPFIDGAIQCIKDDGMLLVTCTDLMVLAGNSYPEKCFALYGGTNLWGDATHESALRLVLHLIANTAAKYGKTIEPQLSLSIDFYVRLFIKVKKAPIKVKELASKTMITTTCAGCSSNHDQPLGRIVDQEADGSVRKNGKKYGLAKVINVGQDCSYCGFTNHITGPMWGGDLHNPEFIDKILEIESRSTDDSVYGTLPRIRGMLTMARQEIQGLNSSFYFSLTTMASVLKCASISIDLMSAALGNLGYESSLTHAAPSCLKTNAPWEVIWFIGKKWCEKINIDVSKMNTATAGYAILTNTEIGKGIDLTSLKNEDEANKDMDEIEWLFHLNEHSLKLAKLRKVKIVRFQKNPEKNWGPMSKPK